MFRDKTIPLISIIMPTYNRGMLLMETIESIRQQTYTEWELQLIDDGSDDNTEELISSINDNRIHFYKAGRIGVLGKLKNLGLYKSKGTLIAFMDSDDLWAPDKLAKQVAAFNKYPEAGFCLTGGYSFKKINEPVDYYYKSVEGERYGDLLLPFFQSEVAALMPSLIFRRDCLPVTGKFIEGRLFSDIAFMLKLAAEFKGVVLYEPLLYRRLHAGNTTNDNWELGYTEYISLVEEYKKSGALPTNVWRDVLFKLYINYGEKCLVKKYKLKAASNFFKAWVHKPKSVVPIRKLVKTVLK